MMNCSIRLNSRLSTVKSGILLLLVIFLCSCQPPYNPFVKEEPQPKTVLIDPPMAWQEKVTEAKRAEGNKQWGNAARLYNDALDIINNRTATPQEPSPAEIQSLYSLASRANMLAKNGQLTRSLVPDSVPDCKSLMRTSVRGVELTKHLIAVEFKHNQTVFTKNGKGVANDLAFCLKTKPVKFSRITLVGHTDETGEEAYNKKLSINRANKLKEYLEQQGVTTLNIYTEGRGEKEPLPDKPGSLSQEERYQLDRRVEVITGS